MSEQYLWDKSGQPDPEVEHLEQVLFVLAEPGPLRKLPLPPESPLIAPWPRMLAFVSAALAILAIGWFGWRASKPDWVATPMGGIPQIGSRNLTRSTHLRVGEWLETDQRSKARISFGKLAILNVEPNTSMRVTRSGATEYRLSLQRGKLNAVIFAPPNLFFVDTPSAVAIDLGCTYTVEVDNDGSSIVHVTHGMVSIQSHGLRSYILAGAVCVARKNSGPDTPYYCDAPPAMIAALKHFDEHASPEALQAVLASARKKDALSLWHVITKAQGPERAAVVDRLAGFVGFPAGVTRNGVIQTDPAMLNQWWTSIRAGITRP